jgi:hypothetical protein
VPEAIGEAMLAETAYYFGVLNNHHDLQVFAVGGATPEDCERLLRQFSALITNPIFREGAKLSKREIECWNLAPDEVRQVSIFR